MNKDTRIEVREKFSKINHTLKDYQAAKENYKKQVAKIKTQADTFSQDYIDKQIKEAQSQLKQAGQAAYEALGQQAADLADKLAEVENRPLDAERIGSLGAAVQLIQSKALDYKTASQLNQTFKGDQTALKTIQRAYQQADLVDGGVDKMIYKHDIDRLPEHLKGVGYSVFFEGNNVNQLSKMVGKVAGYWDVTDHDWNVDPTGIDQALRASAGLPAQE